MHTQSNEKIKSSKNWNVSKHDVYYGELFLKAWDAAETDEESDEENEQVLDNIMEQIDDIAIDDE